MNLLRMISLILLALFSAGLMASQTKVYHFKVLLDDDEIGYHRFVVTPHNTFTYVNTEARFDVKFLFITAYSYLHSNSEVWQGDCLRTIQATTDDNGEDLFVRGEYNKQKLVVRTPAGEQQLEGCIRSFAYWDPKLLSGKRLLNSQTGELVEVAIQQLGESTIQVRGEPVRAQHYRIHNPELSIDLWYSEQQEWLALESTTENGARLRYLVQ